MADVKVSDLAQLVGASVDRLLGQMKEAGLLHDSADSLVSDKEKQVLLAFLKSSHGEESAVPKKITLKRKTTSTLKTGSGSARKTVNVEVRRKRTYVKREIAELPVVEEGPVVETPTTIVEEIPAEVEVVEEALPAEPIIEEKPKESESVVSQRSGLVDDVELKRQAASAARQRAEAERKAYHEELLSKKTTAAKKVKQDDLKQKQAAIEAERLKNQQEEKGKHGRKKEKHHDEFIQDEPRKAKTARKGSGPKKSSSKIDISRLSDDYEEEESSTRHRNRSSKTTNKHGFKKPTVKMIHEVYIPERIAVPELAQRMNMKASALIKELIKMGVMATINEPLDQESAQLVVGELGHTPVLVSGNALEEKLEEDLATVGEYVSRAPVVTVMGHVDHGKTSLLDYIRKAKVASGEAGGITQHIGAYRVKTKHGEITFLDTPGHAAFTAMRARGAQCTDVVILVVAADDGVMPQTEEAIVHARSAGVPLVVAINKCDKESADPDRVKNELAAKDVIPEDWGGDVQFLNVSAHTGEGIEELLEAISLQAELQELTAVKDAAAKGVVVESRVDKGRGVIAAVLVQSGTLTRGNILLAGQIFGRVRAMTNELGQQVQEAGPSTPVELLGLDSAPDAGDEFVVVPDERRAREVAEHRAEREREEKLKRHQAAKLENMFANINAGEKKILTVVVKTDVRGSLEAIQGALRDIGNDEVQVNVVSSGVGGITGNDINLALTSSAIVIGFNVRADGTARKLAEAENIEVRYYSIIYQLLDDVKNALEGMLSPELREEIVGIADVRDVFRSPKFGQVAGCMVVEGTVYRSEPIRVLRDNVVIYEGELESLRRFKDDVDEVRNGTECGIGVKDYHVKVGDQIEVYKVTEVRREL
ncbi:translation initiation factor IF-2 [Candidatus Endobugula sertula]|uniref:Translation initiation factor IF-2 n=1 Tax=Candidatus Endobugula sertula TaxID=62101 RepID=A0A1D2QMK5_9GAMM|nr:translation initiation factor IF-2 [Candidatus Endobugula sertula]